jgi:hypothetical protein
MQITAPFGYDEIIPLQKQHRVLMPAGNTPAFCRRVNAIAVSVSEFVAAARDYPIVFTSLDGGRSFAPVAVLGLAENSNLFIGSTGEWDPAAYLPAFVRRYPFCISKLYVDGEPRSERVVCVAKGYVDAGGVALFDERGAPTLRWQETERLLAGFEEDLDLTARLSAGLARLQLLEPFTLQILAADQSGARLQGMYRVSEARLRDQKPASHKALVSRGLMSAIYAHLHSLANFQRLHARAVTAQAAQLSASRR